MKKIITSLKCFILYLHVLCIDSKIAPLRYCLYVRINKICVCHLCAFQRNSIQQKVYVVYVINRHLNHMWFLPFHTE